MKTAADLLAADAARAARAAQSRASASAPAPRKKGSIAPFDRIGAADVNGGTRASLTHPYANSVWVQRAIKHVAGPISAIPLEFEADLPAGPQPHTDPALAAWWRRPAVGLRLADFLRATVGWRKLAGESFWLLGDEALVPFPAARDLARVPPMILARPDRMRHIVTGGQLIGWSYLDADGISHALLPEQVIQLKEWNPYDPWRGLPEYASAHVAAETNYLAGVYGQNLMRNNGDRGPFISAPGGIPTDAQQEQIVAALRAKRAAASRGEFIPTFLTAEIKVQDPAIQALDASVIQMRLSDRHEVFVAFGVPPSMAEVTASYSIGSASDRYRLIEETCMPESEAIAAGIEQVTARLTGLTLNARFAWDEHSTLQAVRRERVDTALKLWGTGLPMQKANDYLRLGLPEYEGWDVGYLPFSVSPAASLAAYDPTTDPALAESVAPAADPAAVEEMVSALRERRARAVMPVCCRSDASPSAPGSLTAHICSPANIAAWKAHMAQRRAGVRRMTSAIDRSLLAARAETLQKIARYLGDGSAERSAPGVQRAVAADLLFDKKTFSDNLFVRMRKAAAQSLLDAGKQLFTEIKSDDPFAIPPEQVLNFWHQRQNELSDVPDEIFDDIKLTVEQGLRDGDTMDELSSRVRGAFNGISKERSDRIAQTETGIAYGVGRQQAMQEAGIGWKQWLTSGNANVRAAHADAQGQTVRIEDPFIVDGEELMHPGDPNGSAGNIINCHCVSIPVAHSPEGAS
jgi:hypothetical protein